MKWHLAAGVALITVTSIFSFGARGAEDSHNHTGAKAEHQISRPDIKSGRHETLPALGDAENMLKAMEAMPAHDHDACCSLANARAKPKDHEHDH